MPSMSKRSRLFLLNLPRKGGESSKVKPLKDDGGAVCCYSKAHGFMMHLADDAKPSKSVVCDQVTCGKS